MLPTTNFLLSTGLGGWTGFVVGLGGDVGDEKEVEVTTLPPTSPPLPNLIPSHCSLVGEFLVLAAGLEMRRRCVHGGEGGRQTKQ